MDDLRMDEFSTMAMVHEANLTTAALRTINRYLTGFFGRRLMASERKIKNILEDDVPPEIIDVDVSGKKHQFYVKNLTLVIETSVTKRM